MRLTLNEELDHAPAFLAGGGEMGAFIRAHDWAATSLGPPGTWPAPLRMAVRIMLNTGHPMYIWWGEELACLYNDAYSRSIGPERHPGSLGRPGREVWEEIWPIIGPQIEQVMAGRGATWHENQLVPITRNGRREDVYWTYSYGPIDDPDAPTGVGGVLVVCTETTEAVLAQQRLEDLSERNRKLFEQAPGFICTLSGPDHVFEFVNEAYKRLFGDRLLIGLSAREAFPDLEGQGFFELLDRVYSTGERFVAEQIPIRLGATADGAPQEHFLDFIYEPVFDDRKRITGVFVEGYDVTARTRAEAAYRESEARYRSLFESLDAGFCILEMEYDESGRATDYRFIEVNPAFAQQTGLTDAQGKSMRALRPDHEQHWFNTYGEIARTLVRKRFEAPAAALDNRWYDVHAFPIGAPGENRVAVLFYDITERKRVAERLQENEERLRLAADNAEIGFWDVDEINGRLHWTRRVKAMFGISPDVPVSMDDFYAGLHPDDREHTAQAYAAAADPEQRALYDVEYRTIGKEDGVVRWVAAKGRGIFDENGRCLRVAGTAIDISPRRNAELRNLALVELTDRFRELDDPADLAFAAAEVLGRTLGVSRAGYGHVDPLAETITIERDWNAPGIATLAGTLNFRDYGSYIEDLKRGETVVFADAELDPRTSLTADALKAIGAQAVVNMPVRERGGVVGLLYLNHATAREWLPEELALVREVAERTRAAIARREAEDEVRALAALLERKVEERTSELMLAQEALRQSQKLEAMGQLTGGVAHDFNNLLTPIIGSLDLLQRRATGDPREQRLIDGALQSAERAKTLVQRLLAFARRQPLQPRPVDVGALVEGMADLIASTSGPRTKVAVAIAPDVPAAVADPNQLEMAILNLSVNARDAMPDGGRLSIIVGAETIGAGHPTGLPPGRYVCVSVADSGTGMDADTIARAIEPFFSTKGLGKGTGLGLSMVHGLVTQLGGTLTLSSKPGLGTEVELWLPATDREATSEGAAPVVILPAASGRALLVDDEELVRASTAHMLTDMGFEVFETASAEDALRRLGAGDPFDLLVTDHLMPGMTGTELARAAIARRPGLPVLVISGYAELDGIAPDLPRLTKPFRQAELAEALAGLKPLRPSTVQAGTGEMEKRK